METKQVTGNGPDRMPDSRCRTQAGGLEERAGDLATTATGQWWVITFLSSSSLFFSFFKPGNGLSDVRLVVKASLIHENKSSVY